MENIDAKQVTEVVRDFLLTSNPQRPLIIWGRNFTGKTQIIDGVVEALKFSQLLQNEEVKTTTFDQRTVPFVKALGINLGTFNDWGAENFAYCGWFTCCRKIWMTGSRTPHIILEGAYLDEFPTAKIDMINQQCHALSYSYELTPEAWCQWGRDSKRINPYILDFIQDHPEMFLAMRCDIPGKYPTPYFWEEASKQFYKEQEDDILLANTGSNCFGSNNIFQALYQCVYRNVTFAGETFKNWLLEKYKVQMEE